MTQPAMTTGDMPPDGASTRSALLLSLAVAAVILVFGLAVARTRAGPGLTWDTASAEQALATLSRSLAGSGCAALLERARVTTNGQVAEVVIEGFGTFVVQAHYVGLTAVRPAVPPSDRDDCRFTPPLPERLVWGRDDGNGLT